MIHRIRQGLCGPLAFYKKRLAAEINSRALRADALEALACSYLSLTLVLGLGANAIFGWWWADPIAALAMVYFLIKDQHVVLGAAADDHGILFFLRRPKEYEMAIQSTTNTAARPSLKSR